MSKSLIIGLDIGNYSIKAVVLKPSQAGYQLLACHEIVNDDDIFADNDTLNHQEIVNKLKQLKKVLPWRSRKVATALPDNAVFSKVIQIDGDLDPREKEFAIYQSFAHQSPLPIEELSLDFVPLPLKALGQNRGETYQVYATRQEVVTSRVSALAQAGFSATLLDIPCHGFAHILRQVNHTQQRKQWMLVDIGYKQTTLCLDFIDKPPFYKDIAFGTHWLTSLSLTEKIIEPQQRSVEQFYQQFIDRLKRQLQWFNSVQGSGAVAGIWLSGGGSMVEDLAKTVAEQLALPCEIFTPFVAFQPSLAKQQRFDDQAKYATALGLALRGMNWLELRHAA